VSTRRIVLRLLSAWFALSAVAFVLAPRLGTFLAPTALESFRFLHPQLLASFEPEAVTPGRWRLTVTMVQPLILDRDTAIPAGSVLQLDAGVLHVLLPPVILLSLSLALPAASRRARAMSLICALPTAALMTWVLLLVQWSGLLDLEIQATAEAAGIDRAMPWVLSLLLFLEGGGRWLLPIVFGGILAWWAARERRPFPQG